MPSREELNAELDEEVRQFAELLAEKDDEPTGIPKPVSIEVTETSLDETEFGFGLLDPPEAKAFPGPDDGGGGGGGGGGGPPPPPPNCVGLFGSFQCASVSGSKTKCGFSAFDGSNRRFLIQTFTVTANFILHFDNGACKFDCGVVSGTVRTDSYNIEPCALIGCSGTGTWTVNQSGTVGSCGILTDFETNCVITGCETGIWGGGMAESPIQLVTPTHTGCVYVDCPSGQACPGTIIPVLTSTATEKIWIYTVTPGSGTGQQVLALTNEYTTDMLKDNVIDALPDFPSIPCDPETLEEGQGCECKASIDLPDDELSCSIQRFRYRLTFASPSFPCMLRWHEKEFDGNDVFVVSVARQLIVFPGQTFTPTYQVDEPTTNHHYIVVTQP
jgi:hypothetical protein